ncbi:MAG: OmpH family outer membrane protein [Planctomycetaceae bacterium]
MKKFVLTTTVLLSSIVGGAPASWAQAPAAAPAEKADRATRIAVVDIAHLFENYGKWKDYAEERKVEKEQIEADFKAQQEKLVEVATMLNELKAGSPDYAKKEAEAAKLKANLESFKTIKQREFARREMQMQQAIYGEIQEAIGKVSEHNGYSVVLQHLRSDGDNSNPRRLQAQMNQPVVWHRKRDDVTDAVLEYMNRRYQSNAGGVTPASGTRPAAKKAPVKPAAE